jgi:hypothetical protein
LPIDVRVINLSLLLSGFHIDKTITANSSVAGSTASAQNIPGGKASYG